MSAKVNVDTSVGTSSSIDLTFLNADQVKFIDQALFELGEFGEVRLIKAKGKLRFIQRMSSVEVGENRSNSR